MPSVKYVGNNDATDGTVVITGLESGVDLHVGTTGEVTEEELQRLSPRYRLADPEVAAQEEQEAVDARSGADETVTSEGGAQEGAEPATTSPPAETGGSTTRARGGSASS